MASSSSSTASPELYDVFISHRGPDVKHTFAKRLYELLLERGCKPFLDRPEIQPGQSITFAIRNAISSSLVQIAIFSRGYTESSWCLDELVLMLREQPDALFIPVFYDVEPWELRHIENPSSRYAAAFSNYHSKGRYLDKLDEWKRALQSAADISGYQHSSSLHLGNLCENIVSRVLQEVQARKDKMLLDVAKYPVGLAELVQDFERRCFSETRRDKIRAKTVDMVMIAGIYGLGGSGKTTLTKELFNRKSSAYHASSFLFDVRESHGRHELHCLQSQLLKDLLKIEGLNISSVDHGIAELKKRLGRARQLNFLIVLDDVDHLDQLDALLPQGMLSSRSLIIITTRDKSMLRDADICYKMEGLSRNCAKDLFCCHAFRKLDPPIAYEELVESFLRFSGGLPLSLKVLGAHLYGRNEHHWNLELEKVNKIQPKDIMQRLKISFDSLDREEKQIFVDIACLFNKNYKPDLISMAKSIWRASGWSAELALQTLQDKCLVEVISHVLDGDKFEMHDHLRDLGRQMADELDPPRLWKPDILRSLEPKGFQGILAETEGRCFLSIEKMLTMIIYFMGNSIDSTETDLLGLQFLNSYVYREIPPWVPLQKLHYLSVMNVKDMWSTFHRQLETTAQASFQLRKLRISDCPRMGMPMFSDSPPMEKLPDLIGMLSHLEELEICNYFHIDITPLLEPIKQLSTLKSLQLTSLCGGELTSLCGSVSFSPTNSNLNEGRDSNSLEASTSSCMSSLETIHFSGLVNIENLLVNGEFCPRLQSLTVVRSFSLKTIKWLSSPAWLQYLRVQECFKLETMPELSSLTWLKVFEIKYCTRLRLLTSLAHQRHVEHFKVSGCDKLQSVEGFEEGEWGGLKSLVIEVPENGYEWVRNCIYGLKMLPSEKTMLVGKPADTALSRLDVNLFSEVIGIEGVAEMRRGVHTRLRMRSSSNAFTMYCFLASKNSSYVSLDSGDEFMRDVFMRDTSERMITVLLTQYNSESISTPSMTLTKGIMAVVSRREEDEVFTLMQRIVDQLYK